MTVTVAGILGATRIGPGVDVQATTDLVGAIADDDYVLLAVMRSGDGAFSRAVCYGDAVFHGSHSAVVVLGSSQLATPFHAYAGLAVGDAVSIEASARHANGTEFDSGTSTGFTWTDSGLWRLLSLGGGGGLLQAIYDAVHRTFPAQ